jgi:ADP-ribosylglycohydrolase
MDLDERFAGSLLGLALADALGARHEGGPLGALLWKALGGEAGGVLRWTDDTEMAIGTASSLLACGGLDADHLAATWASNMGWRRGYGPGARRLLELIREGADWRRANRAIFPEGSYGNGAAMRAAPVGLFFHRDPDALLRAAALSSSITHAHPLGIEGGVLIARATAIALTEPFDADRFMEDLLRTCTREEFKSRLEAARRPMPAADARRLLGVKIIAHESAVTAVHAFVHHGESFQEMVEFIIGLGGDTDTIGAMAGGIFGARWGVGALPSDLVTKLEARETIESRAHGLAAAVRAKYRS